MGNVWAVARQMIAEGLRMRVALLFLAVLCLLLLGSFTVRGDNTLTGGVQTFITYSLSSVTIVLSLVTLFLPKSVSDELVNKQIFLLMTKPLARWQYLLGKWLGITLMNVMFLAVTGLAIYGTVRYMAGRETPIAGDREQLETEVLVARHAIAFEVPDFSAEAAPLFEQRKAEGKYTFVNDFDEAGEKEKIRQELEILWRSVEPLGEQVFEFRGLMGERRPDRWIQLRYYMGAYGVPPDEMVRTVWLVGNPDKGTPGYRFNRRDVANRHHVFDVPSDAVAEDGTLIVRFINANPFPDERQYGTVVLFEAGNGIEVLFTVGTFAGNLARLLMLILCRLMFLAAVGLLTTCIFSFPVAALVSATLFVIATSRGSLDEAFEYFGDTGMPKTLDTGFKGLMGGVHLLLKGLYVIIPNFRHYDAVELLATGRNVTLMWVLQAIAGLVLVRTAIVMLLACLLFQRREVAEVSV